MGEREQEKNYSNSGLDFGKICQCVLQVTSTSPHSFETEIESFTSELLPNALCACSQQTDLLLDYSTQNRQNFQLSCLSFSLHHIMCSKYLLLFASIELRGMSLLGCCCFVTSHAHYARLTKKTSCHGAYTTPFFQTASVTQECAKIALRGSSGLT